MIKLDDLQTMPHYTNEWSETQETTTPAFLKQLRKKLGLSQRVFARVLGVMDMYVRMYDELKRTEGDNPTIGIILCSDTDEDIARYSILKGNEQLFASKYKLYLPTEEE